MKLIPKKRNYIISFVWVLFAIVTFIPIIGLLNAIQTCEDQGTGLCTLNYIFLISLIILFVLEITSAISRLQLYKSKKSLKK